LAREILDCAKRDGMAHPNVPWHSRDGTVNIQITTSKPQRIFKLQARKIGFGALMFLWMLVLGIWIFLADSAITTPSPPGFWILTPEFIYIPTFLIYGRQGKRA
jgi:hypothetical protein